MHAYKHTPTRRAKANDRTYLGAWSESCDETDSHRFRFLRACTSFRLVWEKFGVCSDLKNSDKHIIDTFMKIYPIYRLSTQTIFHNCLTFPWNFADSASTLQLPNKCNNINIIVCYYFHILFFIMHSPITDSESLN